MPEQRFKKMRGASTSDPSLLRRWIVSLHAGFRSVVEAAGLDWTEARAHLDDTDWEEQVEANRLSLYELGIWGVPSFRLLDAEGSCLLSTWGQDRLWLVARTIAQQLARRELS